MKNIGKISYVAVCLILCVLPFAGMLVRPTDATTENRELAAFPQIKENGKWNIDFMQELGAYFEDHFAFRQELVSADAIIQSKVFGVSNVDRVTVGKNGWLYYTSTVDDYLGRNVMSERSIANAAHNLSLVQQYVQEKGADFVFTVAPNKNSLYGADMPYYFQEKVSSVHNVDLLVPALKKYGVSYVDLFELFQAQDEILYLKRDSHWNQKGAVLAYDAVLNCLDIEHDSYETVKALRLKETYGDLNKMLYPLGGEPEWDYSYQKEDAFSYRTDTESVEDAWIETVNPEGVGSLLMFRDSFGNTLLPLMANTFSKGYFSRGEPQNIGELMEKYQPDAVILEKVERNIMEFAKNPPLMEGPAADLEKLPQEEASVVDSETSLEMVESESNIAYWAVAGILDTAYCGEDAKIYVKIIDGEEQSIREAFTVTTEESDYGYRLYLRKDKIFNKSVDIQVIAENNGKLQIVKSEQVNLQ